MNDKANIWLVDSHTERNRGDDDFDVTILPLSLNLRLLVRVHPGMVIACRDAVVLAKFLCNLFSVIAREGIDDPAHP